MLRQLFNKPFKNQRKLTDHKQGDIPSTIYSNLQANLDSIKRLLNSPDDLIQRVFTLGNSEHKCAIVCIDGLVDKDIINNQIIKNIQLGIPNAKEDIPSSGEDILKELKNGVISNDGLQTADTFDQVMLAILSGDTALLVNGTNKVLIVGSKGWETRSIEEPATESLVRGPREGFTENIRTNTMMIRRHIRDPNLRFESYKVGRRSKKDLIVCYVEGIVHPDILAEVNRRLKAIDIDDAPESGTIEQWIEDSFFSPFPQVLHTERPDKATSSLLQGKVAILLDGTPFVLIAPTTLVSLFQSPEDYYERWFIGSLLRMLRFIAAFFAIFLPAIYISLVSFHQGMIPSKLAFSIAASREGVPFPAIIEAFMMEATLELLREAGVRLPKPIGQTIGIVGGLVIGDAAVQAGIVSPIMIMVVAVTAISSFAIPSYSAGIAFRILRFGTMLAAGFFGLYGIVLVYIMISIHIARLTSFGIPYSAPYSPTFKDDWKDIVFRAPITLLTKRPQYLQTEDDTRANKGDEQS
ncbi:spore germination protein [Bacillus sp. JJ1773]|uniref:spore germination protein n=1 Tax=Bacillus sp. JJ1773 TaxID=3122965 RepID=UPI002FFE8C5D